MRQPARARIEGADKSIVPGAVASKFEFSEVIASPVYQGIKRFTSGAFEFVAHALY
jgi:hypothetical protein